MAELHERARADDAAGVRALLAGGAEVDVPNDWGETPLVTAAGVGAEAAVGALLEAGADVARANDFGFDALKSALWISALPLAERLVAHGAPVDLDAAAALGDLARVKALVSTPVTERAAVVSPWLWACRTGQVAVLAWLLAEGMPVDLHPPGEEWGGVGAPGLHHAAVHGHQEAVALLLAHGADVALVDDVHGSAALAWAASGGHEAVCAQLLAAGADASHVNVHGLSAAALARRAGFDALAERLAAEHPPR